MKRLSVRGDIHCYQTFLSIDIEQVIGNEELTCMNNNLTLAQRQLLDVALLQIYLGSWFFPI